MVTRLFLIRHGVTEWNKQKRYCGCKDVSLSREGRRQAVKLRKRLRLENHGLPSNRQSHKDISFDRIYCSDRKRALQTEKILFGKTSFKEVESLREIDFGVLEGLRHNEIMKKYPEAYREWLADPYKGRIPKAETMQVFKKRVMGVINKIIRLNRGKTVAVVCHGGVIGMFVSTILKNRNFWGYVPSPASITLVEYRNRKFKIRDGS